MNKFKKKAKLIISPPEKQKSKSYIVVHTIGAIAGFIAAIVMLITVHQWVIIFPALFCFLLGLSEAASVYAVKKHGAKVIPPQVVFPIVRSSRNNDIESGNNYPPIKHRKRH